MARTVNTDFDAIAKFAGQYDKNFVKQILNGLDFLSDVWVLQNVSGNGMLLPKLTVNGGIRPLNLNVENPKGTNSNWGGRKITPKPAMKIIKITPDEYRETFLDDGSLQANAQTIPYAQFVMEAEMAKISSEINEVVYDGVDQSDASAWDAEEIYNAGNYVNYSDVIYKCLSTTSAGESPVTAVAKWTDVDALAISKGWGTIIAEEISNDAIVGNNLISTGAITVEDAWDQVNDMFNHLPSVHKAKGGTVLMSCDNYMKYVLSEKAAFQNQAVPDFGDGQKYVFGSAKKWKVKTGGATWMNNSGRVIFNMMDKNLVFGTQIQSDMNKLGLPIRTVHSMVMAAKWTQSCQISDLETLYLNDVA